jgi:hypothetical protein
MKLNEQDQQTAIDFLWMFMRDCEERAEKDPVLKTWVTQCYDWMTKNGLTQYRPKWEK